MKWVWGLIVVLTTGCTGLRLRCPPCTPTERVITVDVPVLVPCHVPLVEPPEQAIAAVAPGDTAGTLRALLADLEAWRRAYEAQREAARACAPD